MPRPSFSPLPYQIRADLFAHLAAMENVVFAPVGLSKNYQAWRTNVEGIIPGPLPFFWDVKKTA